MHKETRIVYFQSYKKYVSALYKKIYSFYC